MHNNSYKSSKPIVRKLLYDEAKRRKVWELKRMNKNEIESDRDRKKESEKNNMLVFIEFAIVRVHTVLFSFLNCVRSM